MSNNNTTTFTRFTVHRDAEDIYRFITGFGRGQSFKVYGTEAFEKFLLDKDIEIPELVNGRGSVNIPDEDQSD